LDEYDHVGSGVGSTQADVVESAGVSQGDDAGVIDAVVADAAVGVGVATGRGIVLATFRATVALFGIPASTLTDNGMVFTTRFAGGRGGRNPLEHALRRLRRTGP
jgi:hypothetical protein